MTRRRDRTDWRTLLRRIRSGKFTPIISDRVFFPGKNTVMQSWAEEIGYPYPLDHDLSIARLAQFLSATSRDDLTAKEDFLEFSKQYLLDSVRAEAPPEQEPFLDTLEDELPEITFSQAAARLDYPRYEDEFSNPLRILAELPLPIYLTTSYYDFLETTLKAAGKTPRTELCYWYDTLDYGPSIFDDNPDYQPTPEEPLVFHLHGLDTSPSSLVLTEDDYLDFLVKVSQDMDALPRRVAQALVDSSLVLLGYRLEDWNFKVVFRGLIKSKRSSRRRLSISIQMDPGEEDEHLRQNAEDVQDYLARYFDKANFDIFWGNAVQFLQELWEQWER